MEKETKKHEKSESKEIEEQELLSKVRDWFMNSISWDSTWRDRANEWYDYYHGNQWTSEEISALQARGQAVTTYNHIKPAIDSVIGAERQNRPKVSMAGRTLDDQRLAEAKTKLYDYITYNSRSDDEIDKMIKDAFITGRGWISVYPQENKDGTTDIIHAHVDWRDMFVDPLSHKDNLEDARYVHAAIYTDADVIKQQFKNFIEEKVEHQQFSSTFGFETSSDDNIWYQDKDRSRVRLINTWYKDEEGNLNTVVWVKGQILYSQKRPYTTNRYPFVQYTIERDMDNLPYGLVKSMVSGQDEVNKRHSKAIHYLNAKSVLAEEDAFVSWTEAEKTLAKPDGITKLVDGALSQGKIQIVDNTALATAHIQMMQIAKENIFYTAGINPTFVGQSSQYESGKKANIAISQGINSIVPILNKLRITRYELAYVTMKLVPDYYTEKRVIRIIEPNGEYAFMPVNQISILDDGTILKMNDLTNDDVDIIIEDAPSGLNEREEQFAQLLQIQGQTSRPIPMEVLLRYSSIKDKHQLANDLEKHYKIEAQLQQAQQQLQDMQKYIEKLGGDYRQIESQLVQQKVQNAVDKEVAKVKQSTSQNPTEGIM